MSDAEIIDIGLDIIVGLLVLVVAALLVGTLVIRSRRVDDAPKQRTLTDEEWRFENGISERIPKTRPSDYK